MNIKEHIDAGHYPVQGQVTLHNGSTAMIYTTDHPDSNFPIIGAVPRLNNEWGIKSWRVDGTAKLGGSGYNILPPANRRVPVRAFVVVGPDMQVRELVATEEEAVRHASDGGWGPGCVAAELTGEIEQPTEETIEPLPVPAEDGVLRYMLDTASDTDRSMRSLIESAGPGQVIEITGLDLGRLGAEGSSAVHATVNPDGSMTVIPVAASDMVQPTRAGTADDDDPGAPVVEPTSSHDLHLMASRRAEQGLQEIRERAEAIDRGNYDMATRAVMRAPHPAPPDAPAHFIDPRDWSQMTDDMRDTISRLCTIISEAPREETSAAAALARQNHARQLIQAYVEQFRGQQAAPDPHRVGQRRRGRNWWP